MTAENDELVRLLPCPFCGSEKIDPTGVFSRDEMTHEDIHSPSCEGCGATAESNELWNKRTRLHDAAEVRLTEDEQLVVAFCRNLYTESANVKGLLAIIDRLSTGAGVDEKAEKARIELTRIGQEMGDYGSAPECTVAEIRKRWADFDNWWDHNPQPPEHIMKQHKDIATLLRVLDERVGADVDGMAWYLKSATQGKYGMEIIEGFIAGGYLKKPPTLGPIMAVLQNLIDEYDAWPEPKPQFESYSICHAKALLAAFPQMGK